MTSRRLAVAAALGALVAVLIVLVPGAASATDRDPRDRYGDGSRESYSPLDGEDCKAPGHRDGELVRDYSPSQRGASELRYYCQVGPPVLKIDFDRGLALLLPGGQTRAASGKVTADPPGRTCESGQANSCLIKYETGKRVTLRATPTNSITEFAGWRGACAEAGSNPVCKVTMDRSKDVTAAFKLRPNP